MRVYVDATLFAEAAALARSRLPRGDPLVASVYSQWAHHCERAGDCVRAAQCFLAAGAPQLATHALLQPLPRWATGAHATASVPHAPLSVRELECLEAATELSMAACESEALTGTAAAPEPSGEWAVAQRLLATCAGAQQRRGRWTEAWRCLGSFLRLLQLRHARSDHAGQSAEEAQLAAHWLLFSADRWLSQLCGEAPGRAPRARGGFELLGVWAPLLRLLPSAAPLVRWAEQGAPTAECVALVERIQAAVAAAPVERSEGAEVRALSAAAHRLCEDWLTAAHHACATAQPAARAWAGLPWARDVLWDVYTRGRAAWLGQVLRALSGGGSAPSGAEGGDERALLALAELRALASPEAPDAPAARKPALSAAARALLSPRLGRAAQLLAADGVRAAAAFLCDGAQAQFGVSPGAEPLLPAWGRALAAAAAPRGPLPQEVAALVLLAAVRRARPLAAVRRCRSVLCCAAQALGRLPAEMADAACAFGTHFALSEPMAAAFRARYVRCCGGALPPYPSRVSLPGMARAPWPPCVLPASCVPPLTVPRRPRAPTMGGCRRRPWRSMNSRRRPSTDAAWRRWQRRLLRRRPSCPQRTASWPRVER